MSEHSDPCICLPLPEPVSEYCPVHGDEYVLPQPSEQQEWTEESVKNFFTSGTHQESCKLLANAINAALATERKITFEAQQAALREGIRAGEFEQQLAAERQRADEAEQELWTMRAGDKVKDDQLLSAQAAIEEHNKTYQVFKQIKVDLSALHQHDAEVRKPLVEALEETRKWIKAVAPHAPFIKVIDNLIQPEKKRGD